MYIAYQSIETGKVDIYKEGTDDTYGAIIFVERIPEEEVSLKYPARRLPSTNSMACPLCANPLGMEFRVV